MEARTNYVVEQTVWVVNGDDVKRESLRDSLSYHGYKVSVFKNIAAALTENANDDQFVIVTAEQLPDGYFGDLLGPLKEQQTVLSTIVTSLDGTIERAVDAFRHGAEDYLVEPYSGIELSDVIKRALNKAKKREAAIT